jgi:hypothetical protein
MSNAKRILPSVVYRALEVQQLYQLHKRPGISGKFIYRTYIYPRYRISYNTMLRYLGRNVKREIRQLEADAAAGTPGEPDHAAVPAVPTDRLQES